MANFTPEQQDTLKIVLGYGALPNLLTTELSEVKPQALVNRVIDLLTELSQIDTQLIAVRSDSMAKSVGQLQLSYTQHIAHLKSEGSRLLNELSNLLGIAVAYNKYGGSGISQKAYW